MLKSDSKNYVSTLLSEIKELRSQLKDSEETLSAIRNGEVDEGEKNFSITSDETPYRIIVEQIIEGAVTVSAKGIIFYCNQRFSEIISVPPEQIPGSDFCNYISVKDRSEFRKLMQTSLMHPVKGEVSAPLGDKSVRLQLSLVALGDDIEGDVCIVVSDITEVYKYQNYLQELVDKRTSRLKIANWQLHEDLKKLRIAEKALQLSEERYSLAMNAARIGTWDHVYDSSGIKINWTDQMLMLFNLAPGSDVTPEIVLERIHPDDRHFVSANFLNAIEKHSCDKWEIRVLWPDKTLHWLHITGKATYHDITGNVSRMNGIAFDITERKKSEIELRESEERYRMLSDTMLQGVVYHDTDGNIIRVNNAFCEITGYNKEELNKILFQDLVYPDDLDDVLKVLHTLYKRELPSLKLEKRYTRKGRKTIWVNLNIAYIGDTEGNREYFVTHVQDITKHKRAEKIIKESKEKFKQVANTIPQLAWIARADGYRYWYNKRWYEYTGSTQKEMEGWGWQKVHSPEKLPFVINQWKSAFNKGEPFEMVLPLLGKDGNFREFLTKITPFKNIEGRVEQWFGTYTDISELKKIEKDLEDSREKLNIALENGNIGTWEWNLRTSKITWDKRTERMFSISPGTFGGTYSDFENIVHEDDLPHLRDALDLTLTSGQPFEAVFRTKRNNVNHSYVSAKGILSKDDSGKPLIMAGVFFDVTAMKKGTEQVLIKLNEDLLRSNRDLQQFAYVASHDLQEPLRMVSSFTQMLQHRYEDKLDADGKEFIRFAVDGCKRMYDLLNGLLAYSRVQTKGKEFTTVDMNDVFDKVQQNLSLKIEETSVMIEKQDLPVIRADESQMIQLVQNLIDNSIKFSTGIPKIYISSSSTMNETVISVKDEGVGIDREFFEKIFKIFQRLVLREDYEGTGIGLAICKRIVERHEGRIWVESEPGKGSTFYFSVPG